MAEVRRELETVVIRLYFERRRLKAEALATDASDGAPAVRVEIRIQELEAELDALTVGAFSRWRASHATDPPATHERETSERRAGDDGVAPTAPPFHGRPAGRRLVRQTERGSAHA